MTQNEDTKDLSDLVCWIKALHKTLEPTNRNSMYHCNTCNGYAMTCRCYVPIKEYKEKEAEQNGN